MGFQPLRPAHRFHLAGQRLRHKGEQVFVFGGFFRLFRLKAQIAAGHGFELLVRKGVQRFQREFVYIVGQIQNLVALVAHRLSLRHPLDLVRRFAARVVDAGLSFRHTVDVFLQRGQLLFVGRIEQQQILQLILVHPEIAVYAVFQLQAEVFEEGFIGFALVLQHGEQLAVDLFLQPRGDQLQLAIVLQHLARDVQRQILRIDQTFDKAVMVGQQIGAFVHDQHAAGVQLQALFVFAGVVVVRRVGRDEQQCLIGGRALGAAVDDPRRILVIHEFILVKGVVFLRLDLAFVFAPDRHHAVDGFGLGDGFVFALFALDRTAGFHIHADGVADVVGIFFDQPLQTVAVQKFVVVFVFGVLFDMQNDLGADAVFFARLHRVALDPFGFPTIRLVAAVGAGDDCDQIAHHERGIKAHAKLTDDVHIVGFLLLLIFESKRAALGDHAEVVFQLLFGHADAGIPNGQGAVLFVHRNVDGKIFAIHILQMLFQRAVVQLVHRVAGVGDQLAQKDFFMGIDRMDHQIQQPLGFGFELFGSHDDFPSLRCFSTRSLRVLTLLYSFSAQSARKYL